MMEPVHRTFRSPRWHTKPLTDLHSAEAISAYLFVVNILAVCTATVVAAVEVWRLKWAWWSRVSFELGCLSMFLLFDLGEFDW